MKRIRRIVLLVLITFIGINVDAATCSISASKKEIHVGESTNILVNVFAGSWNLVASGQGINEKVVGYNEDSNVTTNKSFNFTPTTTGTFTFKLTGDITDYDTDVTTDGINKSVTITVTAAPAPTPQQTTTVATTTKKVTTRVTQQGAPSTVSIPVTQEETTAPVEEVGEVLGESEVNELVINKFKVVGYKFDFDKDKLEYTINVHKDVDELYIIVDGENINVLNDGLVDISNLSNIKVMVSNDTDSREYTININRIESEYKSNHKGLVISIIVLAIFTLLISSVSLYYYVLRKKNK